MPDRLLRCCVLSTLAGLGLQAAVIRGTAVEQQTGRALARTLVTLQPVSGTPGDIRSLRTNNFGQFEFDGLAAGAYVIRASRRGFMTIEYGQKQWDSAGIPFSVAAEASSFLNLRLPRYPGITGTIVDENDVGMPEMEVFAYRATQPPQLVARAVSDDRGVYRIPGLTPGAYLVRTAAWNGDSIDYLPTFSKETLRVDEARMIDVHLDDDARNADTRPIPGRLFTLTAGVSPELVPVGPITVTLASDIGRQTANGSGVQFHGLPPGQYELYAEAAADPAIGARFQSGFTRISVGADTSASIHLWANETRFECAPAAANTPLRVMARRIDLAGRGPAAALTLRDNRAVLALGRWELMLLPPDGYYVSAFSGHGQSSSPRDRADGWNETEIRPNTYLRFSITGGPAVIRGVVKNGADAVAGAPVFLEAWDSANRRRMGELRTVRSDLAGAYRFDGIPPGAYRVLATFEYRNPDESVMEQAGAASVQAEQSGTVTANLSLYELR